MTVFLQELRRNRLALLIWSGAIAVMLVITVVIFPEMKPQMSEMEDMLANMGSLSDAFGMSNMSFARFTDYFATECGNVLGLGGAIFAAITGVRSASTPPNSSTPIRSRAPGSCWKSCWRLSRRS